MSVKHGLLALLANGPKHGYVLGVEYEAATGGDALNRGQIYTTCGRLARDGLIAEKPTGDPGRIVYEITDAGYDLVREWLAGPVESTGAGRDELALKVLLGRVSGAGDVSGFLRLQRESSMTALQSLRARQEASSGGIGEMLNLDRLIYLTEAELRWIDRAEERISADEALSERDQRSES